MYIVHVHVHVKYMYIVHVKYIAKPLIFFRFFYIRIEFSFLTGLKLILKIISNSQIGFSIGIPLRGIAELRGTVFDLRAIVRNCTELCGVSRARNCAQVKSNCVGNPTTPKI